jgi:hypothetical protein
MFGESEYMKMTFQNCGTSWVLFLFGTKQEINERHTSLFNWNATSGELNWLSDGCALCWTSQERLFKYYFNLAVMELWGDDKKGKKDGVKPEATVIAEQRMAALEQEKQPLSWSDGVDLYEMGVIAAEKPDEDLLDWMVMRGFQQA